LNKPGTGGAGAESGHNGRVNEMARAADYGNSAN
jgi:hypothetical protein